MFGCGPTRAVVAQGLLAVFGSATLEETASAHPVLRCAMSGLRVMLSRSVRSATESQLRKRYAPKPRRKCCRRRASGLASD
eukprot:6190041-Pleurochrysis_carterae.AAC.4